MDKKITLFHGSEKVVKTPVFGEGKKNNDFGLLEMAFQIDIHWTPNI